MSAPTPTPSLPRPRIQGLSDLIFGLALSIGAIQLVGHPPTEALGLDKDLLAFAFSFLIVINLWNRYTTLTQVVPVETSAMIRLNILLLFLVAIEPFLLNLLLNPDLEVQSTFWQLTSIYYGLDIAGMNFVLAFFAHLLTREEKKLIPLDQIRRFRVSRNGFFAVGTLFAISAIPLSQFVTVTVFTLPLRTFLWVLTLPVIWLSRIASRRASRPS